MLLEDRKALAGIIVGLAGGGLTMAGPLAFPKTPPWVWQASVAVFSIIVLAGLCVLAYDYFLLPRFKGRKVDPFLATAMAASLIACVSLGIYVFRTPQSVVAGGAPFDSSSTKAMQPEIALLPPKDRYEIRWDPTVTMGIMVQREGYPVQAGLTYPAFILRNSSSVSAQDVTVSWQSEVSGLNELTTSSKMLSKYTIKFDNNSFTLISNTGTLLKNTGSIVSNYYYPYNATTQEQVPFITKDRELGPRLITSS